jgi:hypothetical protein
LLQATRGANNDLSTGLLAYPKKLNAKRWRATEAAAKSANALDAVSIVRQQISSVRDLDYRGRSVEEPRFIV